MQRIFVNAAIKKALCREAKGDRSWLVQDPAVVGPRLSLPHPHEMPAGQPECEGQPSQSEDEGCKPADLAYWFKDSVLHPKPPPNTAEAEAADDAGADARRLQGGAARAGCEAIAPHAVVIPAGRRGAEHGAYSLRDARE